MYIIDKVWYNIDMRRDMRVCVVIALYCLGVAIFSFYLPMASTQQPKPSQAVKAASTVSFTQQSEVLDPNQIFALVNKERLKNSSVALVANEKLGTIATTRASDMVKRQYYAHKDPDGKYYSDYFGQNGITADYSCENLDLIFIPDGRTVITDWLASNSGHRECILNNNLTQAGYAAVKMTYIGYSGKEIPAYLVVAIHTTDLR